MTDDMWITDTLPSSRFPVYTRMNASDVLPDPITPLGASLAWLPQMLAGWAAGYAETGAFGLSELLADDSAVAGFFYGYLYINQSSVRTIGIRLGLGWEAIDAAFFAGSENAPPHRPRPDDLDESKTEAMGARAMWALTSEEFPELDEARALADSCRAQRPDLAAMSPAALVARARSMMPLTRFVWRSYCVASNQSAVGPGVIGQVLGADAAALMVRLIGTAGDVDSAEPPLRLWELSRIVRSDAELSAAFDAGVPGLAAKLSAAHAGFAAQFDDFLATYGFRGPGEWDLGSQTWETRPELALALIERLRLCDDSQSPTLGAEASDRDTAVALATALEILGDNAEAQATLQMAIGSARRMSAWRERSKSNCIKVLHEGRMALVELGNRLVEQGHIDDPQQVFLALDSELDLLVSDPASVTDRLTERRKAWEVLFDLRPPMILDSAEGLPALSELPRRLDQAQSVAAAGDVLVGAAASAGVIRGRARVIHDTSHIDAFEPGEILIAPQTDPSWAPLFMVAAGVVVDVGALNSHAMIVSRELGIPCVAGVTGASGRIPTGAYVEVDGSAGTVTILAG